MDATPTGASVPQQDGFDAVTGGWPSLLQGSIGSLIGTLVGVMGAFLVAYWTTRHELARERGQNEEALKRHALNKVLYVLEDLRLRLADIERKRAIGAFDEGSLRYAYGSWEQCRDELQQRLDEIGNLLPPSILEQAQAVERLAADVFTVVGDPQTGQPIDVSLPDRTYLDHVEREVKAALLVAHAQRRADVEAEAAQLAHVAWYRRPWAPWAVAGVFALALLAVLLFG